MNAMRTLLRSVVVSSLIVLQACGGGGDETPPPVTDTTAPTVPGTPTDGGTFSSSTTITFAWTASTDSGSGVASYWLLVTTGPAGTGTVLYDGTNGTATSRDVTVADGESAYARVKAIDGAGNEAWSGWSDGITVDATPPGTPGTPSDAGAFSTSTTVNFAWTGSNDAGSGIASYWLLVTTGPGGAGTVLYDGTNGTAISRDVTVADGQSAYAQVRAIDLAGNSTSSGWSNGITVDLSASPVAAAPTPDVTRTRNDVLLSWSAVADPTSGTVGYWLQASSTTAVDGSGVFAQVWSTGASGGFDLSARPDGSQVYARVRAQDGAGNLSTWTAWSAGITVDTSGPLFAVGDPTDDGAFSRSPLHVYWADPADPSGVSTSNYLVQLSVDQLNAWASFAGAQSGDALPVVGAPDGTVFYANVTAQDTLGNPATSDWTDGVVVDGTPPSIPAAPSDPGTRQRELDIRFTWGPTTDATSGVRDYTIQVLDGFDAVVDVATVTQTGYVFTGVDGQTYRARLLATDNAGNPSIYGPASDGISISTTAPGTPGVPTDDGQFTSSSSLGFSWTAAAGTLTGYLIELGAGPEHTPVAGCVPPGLATSTVCDVTGQPNGTTFYARVAATDGAGPGGWSAWSNGITLDLVSSPPSAPGTPQDRGATDDTTVTFTWAPAADPESGIQLYDLHVQDGITDYFVQSPDPVVDFDASGLVGATLRAQVRARNGAGTWGPWSPLSDGVVVESDPPSVTSTSPGPGWLAVGRATDIVIDFSEPMDATSVEGALSLSWGSGSPAHGLAFFWDATGRRVTVMPDAADPAGITNVDLLPEQVTVDVTLGTGATDLAGNPLAAPYAFSFAVAEETPPAVLSVAVGGDTSPVLPTAVDGPFTIVVTFTEPMSSMRGAIRLETGNWSYEQRYSDWSPSIQSATSGGGQVTYTTSGCQDIRIGDRVTVEGASPQSFDVARAAVTAVGSDGMGNCTFTVVHSPPEPSSTGGWVGFPLHGDASIAWTSPTTLELTLPPWVTLPPSSESRVVVNNASDLAGNWIWAEESLQVLSAGGDSTPPVLLSSIPLDGATGVSRLNPVILRFDELLDRASLPGTYAVDADGHAWELNYSADEMGPVLLFVPPAGPLTGTRVDVHVPATLRDLAGNSLGTAIDLSFDVAARSDLFEPELFETLPGDGVPVDGLNRAAAIFADAITGRLERLDSLSVGDEDVLVNDFDTGLPIRGYRARNDRGSGVLELEGPPRSNAFGTAWSNGSFSGATALGGVATFTTSGPHGLQPGWQVDIQVWGGDGCFSVVAPVQSVPTADTFTLPTVCFDGASATSGSINWRSPRRYLVTIAVPPAAGGTGILDFDGNAMLPSSFVVNATPPGTNRYPVAESLRDLRLGVTTGRSGRQLSASLQVRDADDDPVTVTLTALGGLPLTGTTQVLTNTQYNAQYWYGGDGPPSVVDPPELDVVNFPSSGYYPFEITLDDGSGGITSYVRDVWVWDSADVPMLIAIDDGGTLRPVDGAEPVVVRNTDRPAVIWSNVDVANADFAGLQYLELTAANIGNDGGGPTAIPLDPSVTSVPFPVALEPSLYAWFATQLKFTPGEMNPESQGWSLDFSPAHFYESTFVYGPANESLALSSYAVGRASFQTDGAGSYTGGWVAVGGYDVQPSAGAPVLMSQAMQSNDLGPTITGTELFAADLPGRFMITTMEPVMGIPLANKGFIGRGGELFAIVAQDQSSLSLEVGVRRDQVDGFGTSLGGRTFAFVQFESRLEPGPSLSTSSSVGVAVADPVVLAITGTRNDGTPLDVGPSGTVPYTLADDGLFTLNVGSTVSGRLGGTSGSHYMGVLADQATPGNDFFLVVAEKYAGWVGSEDESFIAGTYRFVEYTQGNDGAGGLGEVHASQGTLDFDGLGGATYTVFSPFGTMTGAASYSVDPVTGTVTLVADPGTPMETTFLFQVAPDADTLLGSSISSATSPQVLILSR